MNMEEQILLALREQVDTTRLEHIKGVVAMAEKLVKNHSPQQIIEARMAALFHDFARTWPENKLRQYITNQKLSLDQGIEGYAQLLHGYVAADIARRDFNIENEEILEAIRYHTTGKPGMCSLAKIIFLADMLEERRNFPGIEGLRDLAYKNIDAAMLACLSHVILYLIEEGKKIHPLVLETRNSLL